MSARYTSYTNKVRFQTKRNANRFLRDVADEIQKAADPNTPKDTGDLRRSVVTQVLGLSGTIEWRKRYAAVQERGQRAGARPFTDYTTPGTGPHFAENAVNKVAAKYGILVRRNFR